MLGHTYRYQVYNSAGSAITVTLKGRPFKFGTDGSRTDAAEVTHFSAVSVSAAAYSNSSTVDNSTSKNLFEQLTLTAAPSASITGVLQLFLQISTDGGTTWPGDGRGILIDSISFIGSSTAVTKNAQVN